MIYLKRRLYYEHLYKEKRDATKFVNTLPVFYKSKNTKYNVCNTSHIYMNKYQIAVEGLFV